MARTLTIIPAFTPITERDGRITSFFRAAWQTLITGFQLIPAVAIVTALGQTAAIATTTAWVTTSPGMYRVSWYLRKTVAGGVSSSLTMTIGWTDRGAALTQAGAALTTDTTTANQNGSITVRADESTNLTFAIAYASNAAATMTYDYVVTVEQMEARA